MSSVISVMPDRRERCSEEEPSSDADDDFETDEGLTARDAEYERMAAAATAAGVPPRRSGDERALLLQPQRQTRRARASGRRYPPTHPGAPGMGQRHEF